MIIIKGTLVLDWLLFNLHNLILVNFCLKSQKTSPLAFC